MKTFYEFLQQISEDLQSTPEELYQAYRQTAKPMKFKVRDASGKTVEKEFHPDELSPLDARYRGIVSKMKQGDDRETIYEPKPGVKHGKLKGEMGSGEYESNRRKLEEMLGANYETFAKSLGSNIHDPKFVAFLQRGLEDGVKQDDLVKTSTLSVACENLIPTQAEIDIEKSLAFPLKNIKNEVPTSKLLEYFKGGTFAPGGFIVTCCGGKYVIDGHHRWSQLYCLNPKAKMACLNMDNIMFKPSAEGAGMALKAALVGSVAAGIYKSEIVEGSNLIGIDENTLKNYVAQNIGPEAYKAFKIWSQKMGGVNKMTRNVGKFEAYSPSDPVVKYAEDHIWRNVQMMNRRNKPITDASARTFMPQTGDSAEKFMTPLAKGMVNWNPQA